MRPARWVRPARRAHRPHSLRPGAAGPGTPGSPPFIPPPPLRLCPREAARGAPRPLTLRCPRCTSFPRGGAAGIALGLLNPGHSAGSNAALRCVPASLRKTWHLYRPGRPRGQPRGRHEGGHTRPVGSMAHGVGASTPPPPRTCSHWMEIAPRCLLPKLVKGQLGGRGCGWMSPRLPLPSSCSLYSPLPPSQPDRPPLVADKAPHIFPS